LSHFASIDPPSRIEQVHSFYNTEAVTLSTCFSRPQKMEDGKEWPSAEHFIQGSRFVEGAIREEISKAATADAAISMGMPGMLGEPKADWEDARGDVLLAAVRAKFYQHKDLAAELLATGDKTIVMIDNDTWGGMNAATGVPRGKNNVGKALMYVRSELRGSPAI